MSLFNLGKFGGHMPGSGSEFRLIEGSMTEVFQALELPEALSASQTDLAMALGEVQRDLGRTSCVVFDKTAQHLRDLLLPEGERPSYVSTYIQGQLDGGVLTNTLLAWNASCIEATSANDSAGTLTGFRDTLRLMYQDDSTPPLCCGIAIHYLRDDFQTLLPPLADRKTYFVIGLIRNITGTEDQKQATYISQSQYLGGLNAQRGQSLLSADMLSFLESKVNAKKIWILLAPLFQDGQLSLSHFNSLKSRMSPANIDNRDRRSEDLQGVLRILNTETTLQQYGRTVLSRIFDVDFFEHSVFEKTLDEILRKTSKATGLSPDSKVQVRNKIHAMKLELAAFDEKDQWAKAGLLLLMKEDDLGARSMRQLLARARGILALKAKYLSLEVKLRNACQPKEGDLPKGQALRAQGLEVLTQIQRLATMTPETLSPKTLAQLNHVLSSCEALVINPMNRDTVREVATLSKQFHRHASPYWQTLSYALLLLAAAALVVAGVMVALPTLGLGTWAAVAGACGLVSLAGGVKTKGRFVEKSLGSPLSLFHTASTTDPEDPLVPVGKKTL